MATRPVLVAVLGRKKLNFCGETQSRHRFWPGNAQFWRRDPFSSLFWVEKSLIFVAKPNLVTVFGLGMLNFDDETQSRHRFWSGNAQF
ncbi:hypothetical protein P9386_10865 [Caldifermentibacillus hisashii]|uniref:hypothetical protein n=1 Tax=Caldifermentibacillus hisashii TaxID=996558 RepID=UPI002E1DC0D9|nr:hypothetical protein [Caldifermentibacillus hisashii]